MNDIANPILTVPPNDDGGPPSPTPTGFPSRLAPRLNPYDGLFLRAVHLDVIQDHGASRQLKLAKAGGTGVVEGLGVTGDDGHVHIGPGHGIDPSGHILDLGESVRVPLPDHDDPENRTPGTDTQTVWLIVLTRVAWYEGTDQVFGDLCNDPCGPDGTTLARPYIRDGVAVEFRPYDLRMKTRPEHSSDLYRHNRIVSAWFEQERSSVDSWIPARLLDTSWATPPPVVTGDELPLGLAWYYGDRWTVDQWSARRERLEPGNRAGLESRFEMRSRAVFMAQIAQFQDYVSQVWDEEAGDIIELGFVEAPPAGYLPLLADVDTDVPTEGDSPGDAQPAPAETRLAMANRLVAGHGDTIGTPAASADDDNELEARFCLCRPDYVAGAVLEAQHLQRIDLTDPTAQVEVMLPYEIAADGRPSVLGWMAFRRHVGCRGLRENGLSHA